MKFPWEKGSPSNIVVNCETEEEASLFIEDCKRRGIMPLNDNDTYWERNECRTCYFYKGYRVAYESKWRATENGRQIIKFKELFELDKKTELEKLKNIHEATQRIEKEYRETIKALEKEIEEEKQKKYMGVFMEKPKMGEVCWCVDSDGIIKTFYWSNDDTGNRLYKYNLLFKDRQSVEIYSQAYNPKREAEILLQKFALKINWGWKPNWNDVMQRKYYLYYHHRLNRVEKDWCSYTQDHPDWRYYKRELTTDELAYITPILKKYSSCL